MMLADLIPAVLTLAEGEIPNPDSQPIDDLIPQRDLGLGMLKWGGFAVAAGSLILMGYRFAASSYSSKGATTAAETVSRIPYLIMGVLLISGVGAGLVGQFL
ncbi:hypothetical protein [Streptomyces sp. NPDC049879]|uniref:hypothetical protein n=1 Tax=Streptomyces sp. NPDC049879 TaxID=3365598 RepID=UPI00378B65C8